MEKREVVVITGASAGVGRAAVDLFARKGADIGLIARNSERLEAAKAEVERAGGRALVVPADVSDPDQVEAAAERVEKELGPIDIWINCAMTTIFSRFIDITPEEFKRATEVTYLGYVNGTRAALKRMMSRNRGVIVQVGSALAYRAVPIQSTYCGAKFAIRGFTDAVRTELLHDGSKVHITMVQMPALNTPQFDWARIHIAKKPRPVAPVFQPEVAAEAIYYAAHTRRREIYVGLSSVATIVGNKIAPWLLDRYLAKAAFKGQMTDKEPQKDRADNLFDSVPGSFGSHGDFENEAYSKSPQLWTTMRRNWVFPAILMLLASSFIYKGLK